MQKNLVIVIGGPTASGKSSLALDVAKEFDGIIINADSMQIYKDTPILSACPTEDEKKQIPHKLYGLFESARHGTVAEWLKLAAAEIRNAWKNGKMPVVVGGSGMYIDILINGMSPISETSVKIQQETAALLDKIGSHGIHKILEEKDPETAKKLSPNDTTRVRRAYEVLQDTGKSISEWHKEPNIRPIPEAEFYVIKIIPSAQDLDEASFWRFDKMLELGALEEAKKIMSLGLNKNLPAMKALGVPELIDHLEGRTALSEAIVLAKLHTRQYAKRQRTWFNNKLKSDMTLKKCYKSDKNLMKELKKVLHKSS
ncbi:MAG: tRNA (adenosine(37)-N6)-dimethylallyltransferase MiaA [Lactobacillaceae bacterium]|nr:tRNA (adenosine(37)-N6)-dimethylallyltransferase MiaA [Lactobacillaceae bacterium]